MYKISLLDLSNTGRDFRFRVPKDKPLFKTPLGSFSSDLDIQGRVIRREGDFFIVHFEARTDVAVPCRRCLKTCDINVQLVKDLYYKRGGNFEEDTDDDYIIIPTDEKEIDLEGPLSELLLLEFPSYPLCDQDCRGLCPQCGIDLNEGVCDCETESIDPRWEALRSLINRKQKQ